MPRIRSSNAAAAIQAATCPIREVLDRVGSKWSTSILAATSAGPVRFLELERRVEGISRRMLTHTLRTLERDGLVARTVRSAMPPVVEYEATAMGRELHAALAALADWAARHHDGVAAARLAYDRADAKSARRCA